MCCVHWFLEISSREWFCAKKYLPLFWHFLVFKNHLIIQADSDRGSEAYYTNKNTSINWKSHTSKIRIQLFCTSLCCSSVCTVVQGEKIMLALWLRSIYHIAWCVWYRNCAWKQQRRGLREWCFIHIMPSKHSWIGTSGKRSYFSLYCIGLKAWITRVTYNM